MPPEWLPETVAEYKQFVNGNKQIQDYMERTLKDLADALTRAWKNSQCQTCPLGECAALAEAALTFYRETRR